VVDLSHVGKSHDVQKQKNMPLDAILSVLSRQLAPRLTANPISFPSFQVSDRILVLGMGGGADVILACAFAEQIRANHRGVQVITSSCIGPRETVGCVPVLPSTPHILRMPIQHVPVERGMKMHGTIKLEMSIPRMTCGSPYLIVLPSILEKENAVLAPEILALNCNVVIGLDFGGDSVTGGVDIVNGDRSTGRDRQVARVLAGIKQLSASVRTMHIVVAPCSDGESSLEEMVRYGGSEFISAFRVLGFPLTSNEHTFESTLRTLSASLSDDRTPSIALRALDSHLSVERPIGAAQNSVQWSRVPRGKTPLVPTEWLTHAFICKSA
jgi:hypothetical protein